MSTLAFLNPASIHAEGQQIGLNLDVRDGLIAVAKRIAADPDATRQAETGWYHLYFGENWEEVLPANDPPLFALLGLAAAARLREVHRERGIPEKITEDSSHGVAIALNRYARTHQTVGLECWMLGWMRLLASGELNRLGRMEYGLEHFQGELHAYRHRQTGQVLALAAEGATFSAEGYVAEEADTDWQAHLHETETTAAGAPISPLGLALRTEITLPRSEWECVLKPGDTVLDIHIPERDPFTLEICLASFRQALDFFSKFYPERIPVAFVCQSWLLNPQLETLLSSQANLIRFQREPYLFPLPGDTADTCYFLFGKHHIDIATAPRDTHLRRAVLEHLKSGRSLRGGGMFLLAADLPHYGTQFYRRNMIVPDLFRKASS